MKILHCCLAAFYIDNYGYQENIFPVLHQRQGHDVKIIASTETYINNKHLGYIQPGSYLTETNIPITRIPYSKILPHFVTRKLRLYIGLSKIIESYRPDIIFLHDVQFVSVLEIARYAQRKSVVIYADSHTDYINSGKTCISKYLLHKIIYKLCVKIIEPHTRMFYGTLPLRVDFLNQVYGVPHEKLRLLPFGADETHFDLNDAAAVREKVREQYSIGQEDFLIITGGKIDRRKNISILIDAVSNIQKANLKLILFGTVADDLEREINLKCKTNSKIILPGWVSVKDSYALLLASDLGIFPGTHSVIWEQALGVGLPCVFKNWHGMEHLDAGGNCILMSDVSEKSLSETIEKILNDDILYSNLKTAAVKKGIPRFSYERIPKYAIGMTKENHGFS